MPRRRRFSEETFGPTIERLMEETGVTYRALAAMTQLSADGHTELAYGKRTLRVGFDTTLIAEVTSITNTNGYAKAGVMFRDGSAANAGYVLLFVNPTSNPSNYQGVNLEYRNGAGSSSASSTSCAPRKTSRRKSTASSAPSKSSS